MKHKAKAAFSIVFSYIIGFLFLILVYPYTKDDVRLILYGGTIIYLFLCVPLTYSLVDFIKNKSKTFDYPLLHALFSCLIFCICSFLVIGSVLGGFISSTTLTEYIKGSLPITLFFGVSGIVFGLGWRYWVKG
ncbi:hypothetical protein [Aneurinibacillus tyrosinisolvens]|uniref:hypothetical protein n=1 Tax=Aneurinibacillus tyrosinisolvens TaxID=1443435 RepID=UPI00063F9FFF|nr:hypothetical protein [Aneurinibacillus tyrosinisolvens]